MIAAAASRRGLLAPPVIPRLQRQGDDAAVAEKAIEVRVGA